MPWRGGVRCRPRREASASRLVLGLRALTPLVARSSSVCRRLRPCILQFRQLLSLRKAPHVLMVSVWIRAFSIPRSLQSTVPLPPYALRAGSRGCLRPASADAPAALRLPLLRGTSYICSPAIPATAGQGCAPVPMAQRYSSGPPALPAVESPSYLAPTSRRPLPAAAYGLAGLALLGASASEYQTIPCPFSARAPLCRRCQTKPATPLRQRNLGYRYPTRAAADAAGYAFVFAYNLDFHYICYTLEGAYMVTPNPKVQNRNMPVYLPSILISDAYGSMGNLTFYHKNGQCYTRRRSKASYPGTAAQLNHLAVHRRALQAWASLGYSTQLTWNTYETTAEPHRPPFDHKAHISGNNLFVSAYHGFALLGNEHIPEPQPFVKFPPFAVSFQSASDIDGVLQIIADTSISEHNNPARYRLYIRLSLSTPGTGYSLRSMRGFVAD